MPGPKAQAEIMQPAGDFHHHVPDTVLLIADFVLHDPAALYTADCMLNPHLFARNTMILRFLFR